LAEFIACSQPLKAVSPFDEINSRCLGLTHLYTSLMERAVLTGAAVAEALNLPLYGLEDLHEGGGVYLEDSESGDLIGQPGKTPSELAALSDRLVLPAVNPAGWWNRPFEEREGRVERAKRVLEFLTQKHGGTLDRVALFSHAAFFNYFMAAVLGMNQRTSLWLYLNNTGITRFDFNDGETALIYANRTEHLPPELLT
jgi:broad specificity phosphatase PhoE